VGTRGSEMIFVTVFSAGGGSSNATAAIAAGTPPQEAPPPPSVHIEQVSVPPEGLDYTVKSGDTLLAIGLRYGLPWERLADANGLDEHSLLQIGQTVHIPGSGAAAEPPPDVKTEDYTVQPNDTLFSIAAHRGMYWDEVAAVNGFGEHTLLQIGQVIKVPVVEEDPALVTTPLVNTRQVGPVTAEIAAADFDNYTLMNFDNGTGIGGPLPEDPQVAMIQYDPTVAYATSSNESANPAVESAIYVVEAGDTIISIALAHDVEWGELLSLNGLSDDSVLQEGQMIRLR
jgi:LysM repeat protein